MATTAQLAELDEEHRLQQAANAAALIIALNATWEQVDPSNLAKTGYSWLSEALTLIVSRRARSGALALDYARSVRELQIGLEGFSLPQVPGPNMEQIRKSLTYVGLIATGYDLAKIPGRQENIAALDNVDEASRDDLLRKMDEIDRGNRSIDEMTREVMQRAQQRVGMAAVKHVHNGGRDTIDTVVANDRRALGFMRVERPLCCGWCAMLVSRGPVYRDDSFDESDARFTGPGNHKVHDDCGGTLRPVYTRDEAEWTELSKEASAMWADLGKVRGNAAVSEFRRRWRQRNASLA